MATIGKRGVLRALAVAALVLACRAPATITADEITHPSRRWDRCGSLETAGSSNANLPHLWDEVAIAADQTPSPSAGNKRVIQPPDYKPSPAPLSPAILVGDTLYLSGSTGGDPKTGELVKGGFEPELRQIMSNVQTVLASAGMNFTDVVSVTAYLADMADYARFNEIYREYFKTPPLPTRSTVAVKELARAARIELTMTAVRSR